MATFLKDWRIFRRLTLQQLADAVGTTRAQIHKLENKASVSTDWLDRLAKPLGVREGAQLLRSPVDRGEVNFDRPAPNPQGLLLLELFDFVRGLSEEDQRRALRMLKATFGEEATSA